MALISHIVNPMTMEMEIVDPFVVYPFGGAPARAAPARGTPARAAPARGAPGRAAPARAAPAREAPAYVNIRIDWKETPEAHIIKADLPGLKKEDVTVEVEEGGVLQISGEWSEEQVEENETWHRTERSSGQFVRRFRLPENAKLDHVTATMEHGVLIVTIPKEEVKMPAVKAVQISG